MARHSAARDDPCSFLLILVSYWTVVPTVLRLCTRTCTGTRSCLLILVSYGVRGKPAAVGLHRTHRYLGTCTFQHGTASCTVVRVLYNISTAILQSSYLGKATASRLAAPPVTPAPPAPPQWALCSHLDHLVHAVEVGATTDLCLVRAAAGAAVTLLWRRSHRPEGVPAKTSVPCLEPKILVAKRCAQ
eukprot:COSAG01_NODE_9592_length_2399_cov_1.226522_2_plen_188_part_00